MSARECTLGFRRVSVFFVTLLDFTAALAIKQSARRPGLPAGFGRGPLWIACSLALAGLGGFYVLVDALLRPENRGVFSLADLLFLSTYPTALVGLIAMPRVARASISTGRLLVDSTVFIAGVGLTLWFFAVGPGLGSTFRVHLPRSPEPRAA